MNAYIQKMSRPIAPKPSSEMVAAMVSLADGGDVYDHGIATTLREIEKQFPSLIEIGPAKFPPHGAARQPYFGAKLTTAGAQVVIKATRRRR